MQFLDLPPDPSSLVESMRDIGYSMETAIADLVDNSITAEARNIDIFFSWNDGDSHLCIVDDGHGMNADELTAAMRLGSQSPLEERSDLDLGRFGLGLKTASFSQCRSLTVVSRRNAEDELYACSWDLDQLKSDSSNSWRLSLLDTDEIERCPNVTELTEHGTIVIWQKMDRLEGDSNPVVGEKKLNEALAITRRHLELVFHRYLGSGTKRSVKIRLNGHDLQAFDPFHQSNPATQQLPNEIVRVGQSEIHIQPFVLPHHTKVSKSIYERYAGPGGYRRNQGFYVYRNQRLIIWGTWFRLASQEELTKLARVRIDIPNTLDHLWSIDVKKSRATPPEIIRTRLRQIIERIRERGSQVYKQKGARLTSKVVEPLWIRRAAEGKISYEINRDHALISGLAASLESEQQTRLVELLRALEYRFPIENLYNDMATEPENVDRPHLEEDQLRELAKRTIDLLKAAGVSASELLTRMMQMDPFSSHSELVNEAITQEMGANNE